MTDPQFLAAMRKLPCMGCGKPGPSEAHHVQTKGAGGDDSAHNIIPLCGGCHTQDTRAWHRGKLRFLEEKPHVLEYLLLMGWELFNGKLIAPKLKDSVQALTSNDDQGPGSDTRDYRT